MAYTKSKFSFLPFDEIELDGWAKRQLRIQADGLSGNLDKFWHDIKDSRWIGGDAADWERFPYWLDGFVPLAFLLQDDELIARATLYVNSIMDKQESDGWLLLGTDEHGSTDRKDYDVWPLFLILKVLIQYEDATSDKRVQTVVYKALKCLSNHIDGYTLKNWGQMRYFEALISIEYLYERTGEDWLLELAEKLSLQGFNYVKLCEDFPYKKGIHGKWSFMNHVVNMAMALKCFALEYKLTGDRKMLEYTDMFLDKLDKYHGTVTGIFTGDECLNGKSPVQGTELCAVVDEMYSLELLIEITGDQKYADRLERLAFNCLPATMSPDMWSHQYDQQVNQINCKRVKNPIFGTNGGDSNLFGLEPNYGCCTANFSQGWPKFFRSAVMKTPDGLAINYPIPMTVKTTVNGCPVTMQIESEYPFKRDFTIRIETETEFDLSLHIPNFVSDYVTRKYHITERCTELHLNFPMIPKFIERENEMCALAYGPFIGSLKLDEKWTEMKHYALKSSDWEVECQDEWRYGIYTDDIIFVTEKEVGDCPFSPEGSPLEFELSVAKLDWDEENSYAKPEPNSRKPIGEKERKIFIPYGCTNIRMTEMPRLD